MSYKRIGIGVGLTILGILFFVIFQNLDPRSCNLFPKCPVFYLTGIKCPGCGSQRAIHDIFTGNFRSAFQTNALLVISLPYLLLGIISQYLYKPWSQKNWFRKLYGYYAAIICFVIVVSYMIFRNIYNF